MAGIVGLTELQHTNGTNAMTIGTDGSVTNLSGNSYFVNNVTVSSPQTEFEVALPAHATTNGVKCIDIFIKGITTNQNAYIKFSNKSEDGYTDGGYGRSFNFLTGSTHSQNSGNSDANLANCMVVAYYQGTYDIMINCQLIDPSTNLWAFAGFASGDNSTTPVSGRSISHNALGANKPMIGFKIRAEATNSMVTSSMVVGYKYTI